MLAAVMVLPVLSRASLWENETSTWSAAARSWSALGRLLHAQDVVFTVYYAAMHLWIDVAGSSPVALRLPSALCALACIALTARLTTVATGSALAGACAGGWLATNPFFLYYAIDARPYAVVALLAVATTWLLLCSPSRRAPLYYALLAVLGVWMQLFFVVFLGAQVLAVVLVDRDRARRFALAAVLPFVAAAPVAWLAVGQRGQVGWIPRTQPSAYEMWWPHLVGHSGWVAIVFALLVVLGALRFGRSSAATVLGATAAAGSLVLITVSWWVPLYDARYVIESTPMVAALFGAGVVAVVRAGRRTQLPAWRTRVAVVAAGSVAASALLAQGGAAWAHQHRRYFYENVAAAAQALTQDAGPGTALVALPGEARGMLFYYLDRNQDGDLPITDISARVGNAVAAGNFSGSDQSVASITRAAQRFRRVVVLTLGTPPGARTVDAALSQSFRSTGTTDYGAIALSVYVRG